MKEQKKISVVIADTQFLAVEGLRNVLEKENRFSIEAVVSNRTELFEAIKSVPGGLLIIDYSLLDDFAIADLPKLYRQSPALSVLVLINSLSREELIKITPSGIKNIIYKTADREEILTALEFTLKGRKYYSEEILDMLIEPEESKQTNAKQGKLTPSEIEIVKLIANGMTAKEIASRKNLSIHTVNTHRKNIFRKMAVTNVSELLMVAIKAGWIDNIEYYI